MNPAAAPTHTALVRLASVAVLVLFAGICGATLANQMGHFWPIQPWLNAAFVIGALLACLAAFAAALAWPNVLLAAGVVAFVSGMACAISSVTGFPFGRLSFTESAGPSVLGLIPWWLPVAWAVIALSARGTARFCLHRSQSHPQHGYRVIGLAVGLALVSTISLELFATRTAHLWQPTASPALNFASCLVLHLCLQVVVTPLLIDKFPGPRRANSLPLLVWAGVNLMLVAGVFVTGSAR